MLNKKEFIRNRPFDDIDALDMQNKIEDSLKSNIDIITGFGVINGLKVNKVSQKIIKVETGSCFDALGNKLSVNSEELLELVIDAMQDVIVVVTIKNKVIKKDNIDITNKYDLGTDLVYSRDLLVSYELNVHYGVPSGTPVRPQIPSDELELAEILIEGGPTEIKSENIKDIRNFIRRNYPYFNIADFGAVGDGVTDDTIAVASLIDRLSNIGGGKVIIPPNFTLTVRRLQMRSNISLEGHGPTSVIKGHPDALYNQYNIIFIDDDVENAEVKNLKIDANGDARKAFTEPSDVEIDNPIRLEACKNILIENVEIINATKGFGMNLWSGYRPNDQKMLQNVIIRGCTIHVPKDGFQGIAVVQGKNILLENNVIYNTEGGGGWGIVLESNKPILTETYETVYNTLQDITVRNNTCIGTGIAVLGQGLINNKNIKILDNTIEVLSGGAAFQTYMIHDVLFDGNNIIYDSPHPESRVFYINGRSIKIRNNKVHLKKDVLNGLFSYSGTGVIASDAAGTSFLESDSIYYEDNEFTTSNNSSCYWHMQIIDNGRHLIRNNNIPMSAYSYAMQISRINEINIIDSSLYGYWGIYFDTPNNDGTTININNTKIYANKNHIQNADKLIINDCYFEGLNHNDSVLNDLKAHNDELYWSRDNIVSGEGLQNHFKTNPINIFSDNIPFDGIWNVGDTITNTNPKPGGFMGWVCTDYGYANNGVWSPNYEYFLGQIINNNDRVYECVKAGISSSNEEDIPTWSQDYTDGTVQWKHIGFMAEFKPFGLISE